MICTGNETNPGSKFVVYVSRKKIYAKTECSFFWQSESHGNSQDIPICEKAYVRNVPLKSLKLFDCLYVCHISTCVRV